MLRFPGKDTTQYRNIHVWDKEPAHLYQIQKDPDEMKDLAEERPEVVQRIKGEIESWRKGLQSHAR